MRRARATRTTRRWPDRNFRSRPSRHADGQLRHAVCEGGPGRLCRCCIRGSPAASYTLVFTGDVNGDNRTWHPPLSIPPNQSDPLTYTGGGTYADFIRWINGDSCLADFVGADHPRDACRAPWTNTLDGRFGVQPPGTSVSRPRSRSTCLNLISTCSDSDKRGRIPLTRRTRNRRSRRPCRAPPTLAKPPLTGYNIGTRGLADVRAVPNRDDLRSRWHIQLGARVRFATTQSFFIQTPGPSLRARRCVVLGGDNPFRVRRE